MAAAKQLTNLPFIHTYTPSPSIISEKVQLAIITWGARTSLSVIIQVEQFPFDDFLNICFETSAFCTV